MHRQIRSALILLAVFTLAACSDQASDSSSVGQVLDTISAETSQGAELARAKCASCHNLTQSRRKIGPGLKGIYGKKPGITGVPFEVWDETALDHWLAGPTDVKPGTPMAIPGLKDEKERQAIISYLKQI